MDRLFRFPPLHFLKYVVFLLKYVLGGIQMMQTIDAPVIRSASKPFGPIRLYEDQEAQIEKIVQESGATKTDVLRQLIDFALKAMQPKSK